MKSSREEVYEAIDSEREYQQQRWNVDTTTSRGEHEIEAWVLFMEDYLLEARKQLSRNGRPLAHCLALESIRKVTAMGVACMEQNGAPKR